MTETRTEIRAWIEQGRLQAQALPTALELAGLSPDRAAWRLFFNHLMLWLGAVFCACAVIFFFAYNWQAMGRFAKFGLMEIIVLASLVLCWRLTLESVAGQGALLSATLLTGGLLALVGQTYQTGADTYELFGTWAMAVFPWVAVSCFSVLWFFWLILLNLTVILYFQTFNNWLGFDVGAEHILWILFALNSLAWCCWEAGAQFGISWLNGRWAHRLLAVINGGLITSLAVFAVLDIEVNSGLALPVYFAWLGIAYSMYRHCFKDVFVLAGGVLSVIIFLTVWLSKIFLNHGDAGSFLFIGLFVIGLSALGGFWLKSVANEQPS